MNDFMYIQTNDNKVPQGSSYTLYLLEHVVYLAPNGLSTQLVNYIKLILD